MVALIQTLKAYLNEADPDSFEVGATFGDCGNSEPKQDAPARLASTRATIVRTKRFRYPGLIIHRQYLPTIPLLDLEKGSTLWV